MLSFDVGSLLFENQHGRDNISSFMMADDQPPSLGSFHTAYSETSAEMLVDSMSLDSVQFSTGQQATQQRTSQNIGLHFVPHIVFINNILNYLSVCNLNIFSPFN